MPKRIVSIGVMYEFKKLSVVVRLGLLLLQCQSYIDTQPLSSSKLVDYILLSEITVRNIYQDQVAFADVDGNDFGMKGLGLCYFLLSDVVLNEYCCAFFPSRCCDSFETLHHYLYCPDYCISL